MKKFSVILIACLMYSLSGFSQINPYSGLMPNVGDLKLQSTTPVKPLLEEMWGKQLKGKLMIEDYNPNFKNSIEKTLKDKESDCGAIAFDAAKVVLCEPSGESFIVNYSGFTPEARRAFQYAVDIWSRLLNLTVPIEINAQFTSLGPGILGSAGPTSFFNFGIVYPSALADQLIGFDLIGPDMNINFSSDFSWYYGLDGCAPAGTFDFTTVVLHEIGHGLGFLSSDFTFGPNDFPGILGPGHPGGACIGFGGGTLPYIFDLFIESASFGGDPYQATLDPSVTPIPGQPGCFYGLDAYFTNDDLTFNGPNTVACFGSAPALYAPTTYAGGSSISHFDESTFSGNSPNSLLTPFYSGGNHDPGCALAVFQDLLSPFGAEGIVNRTVPECEVVPTMGEWGLLSLGLILLILGVVTIKSRKLVFG